MSIFTYHLVKTSFLTTLKVYTFPIKAKNIAGLKYVEVMSCMTLGSPVFSPSRILFNQIAVFAEWESEEDIDNFLKSNSFGKKLSKGWWVYLSLVRYWGKVSGIDTTLNKNTVISLEENETVVAITIAKMKFLEVPRFIYWGKPVEKLVRDHSGTTLSLASYKFPNTVSTFSIWKSTKEMTDMVFGHSKMKNPNRHINAMKERERKDFHFEFTTLRFKPIAEFGIWEGCENYIFKK